MVRNDHKLILVAIAMCIIVPIVVYLGLQAYFSKEFFSTVLYADGTLIIEESSLDKKENEEKHGAIMKEYPSFIEDGYIFDNDVNRPHWQEDSAWIKSVEVGSKIQPTDMSFWFDNLHHVEYIDVSNIDTSQVESMAYLFRDTGFYVDNGFMIKGLDSWDTSNVTDMQWMFRAAGGTANEFKLDGGLDDWDTSKVKIMVYMFDSAGGEAQSWYIGDLSNWDTSSVIAANNMFGNYANEANIDQRVLEWNDKFTLAGIQNASNKGIN